MKELSRDCKRIMNSERGPCSSMVADDEWPQGGSTGPEHRHGHLLLCCHKCIFNESAPLAPLQSMTVPWGWHDPNFVPVKRRFWTNPLLLWLRNVNNLSSEAISLAPHSGPYLRWEQGLSPSQCWRQVWSHLELLLSNRLFFLIKGPSEKLWESAKLSLFFLCCAFAAVV